MQETALLISGIILYFNRKSSDYVENLSSLFVDTLWSKGFWRRSRIQKTSVGIEIRLE
jgi:hypothetical protein